MCFFFKNNKYLKIKIRLKLNVNIMVTHVIPSFWGGQTWLDFGTCFDWEFDLDMT